MFFLFLPFRMAKLKVLILVWIGYEWMGTFIHCVNWCKHSEGQFCVYIKTFKCMKFTLWYICKIYQDMHTYTQWYCSVIYSREQTRKYINEKLVELVCHIYKVAWGGCVCKCGNICKIHHPMRKARWRTVYKVSFFWCKSRNRISYIFIWKTAEKLLAVFTKGWRDY